MKKNNKGFTLVELIVVLVILAILAAILVPALLGWIDKAREKSVTTNAEAAYVAAQGLVTEQYGAYADPSSAAIASKTGKSTFSAAINNLADIEEASFSVDYKLRASYSKTKPSRNMYKIGTFAYYSPKADKTATWIYTTGEWTVVDGQQSAPDLPTTP